MSGQVAPASWARRGSSRGGSNESSGARNKRSPATAETHPAGDPRGDLPKRIRDLCANRATTMAITKGGESGRRRSDSNRARRVVRNDVGTSRLKHRITGPWAVQPNGPESGIGRLLSGLTIARNRASGGRSSDLRKRKSRISTFAAQNEPHTRRREWGWQT
jgi:hypothetical protein